MARPYKPWYGFIIVLARTLLFLIPGGLRVKGRENVPLDGPLLVAPNHVSNLDPEAVAVSMPRQIAFMGKAELFKVPVLAPLIRSLGCFPVHRGTADTEALRLAYKLLGEGRALLMFPEGQRGNGKQLGAVSRGIAMVARRSGAPVLPVAVIGTHKRMPKGKAIPRLGRTIVVFGRPLRFEEFLEGRSEKEAGEALAREWCSRVIEMCRAEGWQLGEAKSEGDDLGSPSDGGESACTSSAGGIQG